MEFATGALGTLLPKLGQLLQGEYNLQKGAKKDIEFLLWELESTHAALRKVGNMPPEQLDEQVRIWARQAREVSYDMEDIVDIWRAASLNPSQVLVRIQGPDQRRPSKRSAKRFIKDMRDFVTKAKVRHDIAQEIKNIKERVKEVAERRDRYKVDAITPAKTVVDPRIASMYTKAADLVGIDGSMQELITRFTKGDDKCVQHQRIVSVVGFGGLGKTTLAKAVYDKLKGQFDCTAFVSVGRNPYLKKVLKDILIDLHMHFNLEILDERHLIEKLREFLENKRYIIVIDDVWEIESWERIKLALIENSGSRIIVTTRNYEIARKVGDVYELQPLSYDNSRKLFFGRISGGESKSADDQQDDEVSDRILKKCGGIPLAIITMASLLLDKPREDWSEVHRSISFGHNINEGNTQVESTMKILSFSYYELPPHLRACLLYLSMFPEDHFIEKTPLIWMWIAEGFVCEEQGMSSFEIGEGYFNKLVNRSMIQLAKEFIEWGHRDMVCGCRVHDMVLDLIRSVSSQENFITRLLDGRKARVSSSSSSRLGQGKVRRLALQSDGTMVAHMEDMQQVRSFISHGCDIGNKGGSLLSSFKLVRVLVIHTSSGQGIDITHWHLKPIQNLVHLRVLQLSGRYVFLPEKEIATLNFLQTLDVKTTGASTHVPASVGLLTQLRCLRIRAPVVRIPDGIGKLTSLEELEIKNDFYSVADGDEEAWRGFINELGGLRELRVLRVGMRPSLENAEVHMVQPLCNLHKLEHLALSLSWWTSIHVDTEKWEEAVGGGSLLPRRLRQLFVSILTFSRFPAFFLNASRLPILSHLSLHVQRLDAQGGLWILGELPELHYLELYVDSTVQLVHTVVAADDDACSFRKLRHCKLHWYGGVRLLSSEEDSGGVSIHMGRVVGNMLLGSGRNKQDVAPTLLPSVQELWFHIDVKGLKDGNGSVGLEYFASVNNVTVTIFCEGASAAEVEQVEAALRRSAAMHPNRPTLEVDII
ncbi:unnamed protein product [Urochloa decumbens]|uniref:Uncharacterized protein n=1 Tax=Urochloa decumbens TaxID=240449 RepID=A0ABC9AQF2_9POAL